MDFWEQNLTRQTVLRQPQSNTMQHQDYLGNSMGNIKFEYGFSKTGINRNKQLGQVTYLRADQDRERKIKGGKQEGQETKKFRISFKMNLIHH